VSSWVLNRVKVNLLTYLLTYSMEQSPSWEANLFTGSQEIPRILWNRRVHYSIQKCLQTVPVLSHLDPVHTPSSHILNICLNIILPSTPVSSKWLLSITFLHQNPVYTFHLLHTHYMPRPTNSFRFDHTSNIGWGIWLISHVELKTSSSYIILAPSIWPARVNV